MSYQTITTKGEGTHMFINATTAIVLGIILMLAAVLIWRGLK